jgi:hypothetical protein
MPTPFLGVDMAGILAANLQVVEATLRKATATTRDPSNLSGGTHPTFTSWPCRGFIEDYKDGKIDGTLVKRGDRKATLMGATLAAGVVPMPNDEVTVEGRTYVVVAVFRDPAGATYGCQVR